MLESQHQQGQAVSTLTLPDLDATEMAGGRVIYRAVTITLLMLGVLATLAIVLSLLISINVTVNAENGVLEPGSVVAVRSQESGVIQRMLTAPGDTVVVGQVLALLDSLQLDAQLTQLESEYRSQELDLRNNQTVLPLRSKELAARRTEGEAGILRARANLRLRAAAFDLEVDPDSMRLHYEPGTHIALDLAMADVFAAEASIQAIDVEAERLRADLSLIGQGQESLSRLEAQLKALRARLGRLSIAAPVRGIVLTDRLDERVGTYVGEGQEVLEIGDLSTWRTFLFVDQRRVHRLEVGQTALVEIGALGSSQRDPINGVIVSVSPEPVPPDAGVGAGLYRVEVLLDDEHLELAGAARLKRGYTLTGKFVTRREKISVLIYDYFTGELGGRG